MNAPGESRPASLIRRRGPLALLARGHEAMRTVPRLRAFLLKGFLLNYVIFILLAALGMGVLYQFVVQPLSQQIGLLGQGGGFFAGLVSASLNVLLWLTQALLMAASLLFSFLVALAVMSLWYEALAGRIVAHFRGQAALEATGGFSLRAWLASLARSLRDSVVLLLVSLLSLGLGFVPLLGPVLVIGINSFLLGWEVREPYLMVREALGDDRRALRRGLVPWTARVGLLPVVLALVPWLGWVLLPAAMIYLVAGTAWENEQARQARRA